jgi:cell division protein FtsI (penicillin-binding protein 3)
LAKSNAKVVEDEGGANSGDIAALYEAANELPSDDPLRDGSSQNAAAPQSSIQPAGSAAKASAQIAAASAPPVPQQPKAAARQTTVMVSEAKRLQVPSLIGLSVRKVIEQAAAAGLEVQITGNGTVREQAPAPGTMVAPGTQIVVRCGR